jgi:hypothetical protein
MQVGEFGDVDWPPVWAIVRDVVRARETFTASP